MKKFSTALCAATLLAASTASLALAQTTKPAEESAKPAMSAGARCADEMAAPEHTFYLRNATQQADANDVVTALRNLLDPCDKVFLVSSRSAIAVRAGSDNVELAQKLLSELDLPKKTYRLTFTVTTVDDGKPAGTQHFAMIVVAGQQTKLKQGSKVPIATGSYSSTAAAGDHPSPAGVQTQFTYIDTGMNFDATLQTTSEGAVMKYDVDQSSVAPETSGVGAQDPIVRQTELQGEATLAPNKPQMLGSIDIPGTTRRLDIEALMEPLP